MGATDNEDHHWEDSEYNDDVELSAPGVNILSTAPGNEYSAWDGTSFSSPLTAGLGALIRDYVLYSGDVLFANCLHHPDYQHIMIASCDDLGDPGRDPFFGYGRINASRALNMLRWPYSVRAFDFNTIAQSCLKEFTHVSAAQFYDVPGIPDGVHIDIDVCRVTKYCTFPYPYETEPYVWGRTELRVDPLMGYEYRFPNFGIPWCDVWEDRVTPFGCYMQTFCFRLNRLPGRPWFPFDPTDPDQEIRFRCGTIGTYHVERPVLHGHLEGNRAHLDWSFDPKGYILDRFEVWCYYRTPHPYLVYQGNETQCVGLNPFEPGERGFYYVTAHVKTNPSPYCSDAVVLQLACPFVYVRDESGEYVADNNILRPVEELKRDYLKLRHKPVNWDAAGLLELQIREFENEVSWIDYVGLTSYGPDSLGHRIDFLADGTPVMHDDGIPPASAVSTVMDSADVTALVSDEDDGLYVEGDSGDCLIATLDWSRFDRHFFRRPVAAFRTRPG